LEIQVSAYKMGNYHPSLMKFDTQTKTNMLSSKITKAEAYGKKHKKLNVKTTSFKKTTLYEREVIKKQKFLFAGRSFHTHTTGG
jgi:AMMECR1 domain-containing protein